MAKLIYNSYKEIMDIKTADVHRIGIDTRIPCFDKDIITKLCSETKEKLMKEKNIIEVKQPAYIVGDIHGNLHDLLKIFSIQGYPPKVKYVFLGDYVDRGEYSVEVITLLFSLHCLYPEHVTLIRGNHEFRHVNSNYGFYESTTAIYEDDDVWREFNDAFDYLPIAAIINRKIFCIHAGISNENNIVQKIESIKRPLYDFNDEFVSDILWSDPDKNVEEFELSKRGAGKIFGMKPLKRFLKENSFYVLIRGHQCVPNGVQTMFNNKLITVFSSSRYAPSLDNDCGFLEITDDMNAVSHNIGVQPKLLHSLTKFLKVHEHKKMPIKRSSSVSRTLKKELIRRKPRKNSV